MLDIHAFPNFSAAVQAVLKYLHQHIGFDLWMVTRTEGNDWIVLQANDHHYGVQGGDVLQWQDSFCARMVEQDAPRVAPCSRAIPVYATAPINDQLEIGAYIGVPLTHNGELFGTLCAIHPTPQDESVIADLPLVELMAKLLSTILSAELATSEQERLTQRAVSDAMHDGLTGLYNRRGWDYLLRLEEKRCEQFGHPACLISIDLDGLKQVNDSQGHAKGDELIIQAAQILQTVMRDQDLVARLGGDEFAILCIECNQEAGIQIMKRLQSALTSADISASSGMAVCRPGQSLFHTYQVADQMMYDCKRNRVNSNCVRNYSTTHSC
jgi:diguanylate cyclase (GGDEF)-like protein